MFIQQGISTATFIFRGIFSVSQSDTASNRALPFEIEHFADPKTGDDRARPAAGEEQKIPCLKSKHSDKATVIIVDGSAVKIEATNRAGSEESIYLVNGNQVAVHHQYDPSARKTHIDLKYAGYVQQQSSGGFESASVKIRVPGVGVLHLSERDEQAVYQFWSDTVAGLSKRQRSGYEIIPLYSKPQMPPGRTGPRRKPAEPIQ